MKPVSVWFIKMLDTWITWGDSFPQLQSPETGRLPSQAPVWRCDGTPPGDHWCVTRQPGARPSGKPNRSRRTAGWHRMCLFSITKPFWEEKLLGTKRCGQKGMRVSSYLKKTHLDTGSWTSHFIVLVPYFRWRSFGIKSVMEAIHKLKKTTYTKCRQNSSGTGLVGGGRGAGHLWIATQAPGAILWWFWGKPASRRVGWTLHIQKVASLGRWIF